MSAVSEAVESVAFVCHWQSAFIVLSEFTVHNGYP